MTDNDVGAVACPQPDVRGRQISAIRRAIFPMEIPLILITFSENVIKCLFIVKLPLREHSGSDLIRQTIR